MESLVKTIKEVKEIVKDKYELPFVISRESLTKFIDDVVYKEENPIKYVLATKKNRQPAKSRLDLITIPISKQGIKNEAQKFRSEIMTKGKKITKFYGLQTPPEINKKIIRDWKDTYLSILYSQLHPRNFERMTDFIYKKVQKNEIIVLEIFTSFISNILDELFEYYGSNMEALQLIIGGLEDIVRDINSNARISDKISNVILKHFNAKNKKIIYNLLNPKPEPKSKPKPKSKPVSEPKPDDEPWRKDKKLFLDMKKNRILEVGFKEIYIFLTGNKYIVVKVGDGTKFYDAYAIIDKSQIKKVGDIYKPLDVYKMVKNKQEATKEFKKLEK